MGKVVDVIERRTLTFEQQKLLKTIHDMVWAMVQGLRDDNYDVNMSNDLYAIEDVLDINYYLGED